MNVQNYKNVAIIKCREIQNFQKPYELSQIKQIKQRQKLQLNNFPASNYMFKVINRPDWKKV